MRQLGFLAVLVILYIPISCSLDAECFNQSVINGQEFYLIESNERQFVGLTEEQFSFVLCGAYTPPAGIDGINNIFRMAGTITVDCSTGSCLSITDIDNPDCEVAVTSREEPTTFVGQWRFIQMLTNQGVLDPSCLTTIDFNINESTVEGMYLVSGTTGVNPLFMTLRQESNYYLKVDLSFEQSPMPPYVALVENTIQEFLSQTDTLWFDFNENRMFLRGSDPAVGMRFFQR